MLFVKGLIYAQRDTTFGREAILQKQCGKCSSFVWRENACYASSTFLGQVPRGQVADPVVKFIGTSCIINFLLYILIYQSLTVPVSNLLCATRCSWLELISVNHKPGKNERWLKIKWKFYFLDQAQTCVHPLCNALTDICHLWLPEKRSAVTLIVLPQI